MPIAVKNVVLFPTFDGFDMAHATATWQSYLQAYYARSSSVFFLWHRANEVFSESTRASCQFHAKAALWHAERVTFAIVKSICFDAAQQKRTRPPTTRPPSSDWFPMYKLRISLAFAFILRLHDGQDLPFLHYMGRLWAVCPEDTLATQMSGWKLVTVCDEWAHTHTHTHTHTHILRP